jgi:hypothetical protein
VFGLKYEKPPDEVAFSKKLCKMYRAMSYMDKAKQAEPQMSLALRDLVKPLFAELKELHAGGGARSMQSSTGFLDGLSMSQFKISDDLSNWGSEVSFAQSTLLAAQTNLETINELPRGGAGAFRTLNASQDGAVSLGPGAALPEKREVSREKRRAKPLSDACAEMPAQGAATRNP